MGASEGGSGPWNPGVLSQIPGPWRALSTLFMPENTYSNLAAIEELRTLTGLGLSDLVVFRPERLALHELLIRVTADFVVPDGSRIEDLGINFRRIASRLFVRHLEPEMNAIRDAFSQTRDRVTDAVESALASLGGGAALKGRDGDRPLGLRGWFRRPAAATSATVRSWQFDHLGECERRANDAADMFQRTIYRALVRVLSGLFSTHGHAWGSRELIVPLARDIACNVLGSDAIGRTIDPWLRQAAAQEGYGLLPRQDRPVVINTKGASASGKSTLRPLQKKLAGDIGVRWSDFALISPDIWRKQLLDYGSLGPAYKYAGAFTGEELQIVDRKLDRYMAQKHAQGNMSHLLIDRFRFDSFAPDSDEEGSNLLTRFGQTVYLFFVITPPDQLVERAWKRGLEFGRFKAVDDTLAHSVEAYSGIPGVFFTWIRRSDKRIQFEFLDNTVAMGERPRTVAFGDNETVNVLDVERMLDIDRFGRVSVDASTPDTLYPEPSILAPENNLGFLKRCIEGFRKVNFADQASGRIYLTIEAGATIFVDRDAIKVALEDHDTAVGIRAVSRDLPEDGGTVAEPRYLRREEPVNGRRVATLGVWGYEAPAQR